MKKLIFLLAPLIFFAPTFALGEDASRCTNTGWCPCGACMRNYSTCEEACGLTSRSGSSGGGITPGQQIIIQNIGNSIGQSIGKALFGNPEADAKRQAEADRSATMQRQAEAQRKAEEQRQLELSKQRILGALKGSESSGGLALKTDSDDTLSVTETRGAFGSTVVTPTRTNSPPAKHGLQLKLGDDADRGSMQARQGFDTAGNITGSNLPPQPPKPTAKSPAEKTQWLNALRAKLQKNEADEQLLKNQLAQLQQAPTPDTIAINQVQQQIVVKEAEKKKIKLDLTAGDPD